MVERSLSMREVPGSIPGTSTESFWLFGTINCVWFIGPSDYIMLYNSSDTTMQYGSSQSMELRNDQPNMVNC